MRPFYIKLLLIGFFILNLFKGNGQSIGYSFSYTLPYEFSRDYFIYDGGSFIEKLEKGAELSIGLSLSSYISRNTLFQIRLSKYSSTFSMGSSFFSSINNTESSTDRYYAELEGYFVSKGIENLLFFNLGVKYAYLLKSSHESFSYVNEVRTDHRDPEFGGPAQSKFAVLLKANWRNIALSEDFSIIPSYVFGYELANDFMSNQSNTSSFIHRFEIGLFKKLGKR